MDVSITGEVVNPNIMKIFDERLKRIVEESYEVAFILCNKEMEEFSSSKVFDIFAQVFTTAYVLNTAYWPFFSTISGQSLCVCGRFGIPCRHVKNGSHWIDMQPIEHDPSGTIFYPRLYGPIVIQDYEVLVKSIDGNGEYHINIILNIQYKKNDRGRPRREKIAKSMQKDVSRKTYPLSIFSRFYTTNQYYSPLFTIVFQPNPFFNEYYGTLFKKLIQFRAQEFSVFFMEHHRQILCITYSQMPSTTFVPYHVNVPVFKFSSQLLVFNQIMLKSKQHSVKHKSVQTNEGHSSIGGTAAAWGGYCVEETSITKSLRTFANNATHLNPDAEEFMIIEDSEEFDNQWPAVGYSKIVQPNQLMIKYANNVQIIDHDVQNLSAKRKLSSWSPKEEEPDSTTINDASFVNTSQNFPSLVPEMSARPGGSLNFSKAVKEAQKEQRKNDGRDEYWFDKNFPPLKNFSATYMAKNEVDAEFEIIENVIKEDVLEQEGNLDWWNNIKQ